MTCIAGLIEDGRIWMGGDSCIANNVTRTSATPKVFRKGPYLFGFAGDCRESQVLEHLTKLPKPEGRNTDRFMVTSFAYALRKSFNAVATIQKENDREKHNSTILIGVRGSLYSCWNDFQMLRVKGPYQAIGSGDEIAMGAFHALEPYDVTPRQKVLAALKASAEFSPYVAAPFHIKSMEIE